MDREQTDDDNDTGEGDDGFGDFQEGGGNGTVEGTETGAIAIPNLLDTLKGIDGRGDLAMSYESGATEPEASRRRGPRDPEGHEDEDWGDGLR